MLASLLLIAVQAATSPSDLDARFKALKSQTEAIIATIDASSEPKPVAKDGMVIGDYRVSIDTDDMTDERTVSITTKAIGAGKKEVEFTAQCDGDELEFLYYFDRPVFDANSTLVGRWRVDQNEMRSIGDTQTKDNAGVWIQRSYLDLLVGDPRPNGATPYLPIVAELSGGNRLRIQINPDVNASTDHVFSLKGFARAVRVLPCVE